MRIARAQVAQMFLSLVLALPICGEDNPGGGGAKQAFADALRLARTNLKTPEGKQYDARLASYSAEHDGSAIGDCIAAAKKPDLSSFQLLLRVGGDGLVTKAVVRPETNVSVCFMQKLKESVRPKPPRSDYWVLVEMTLSQ